MAREVEGLQIVVADDNLLKMLQKYPTSYTVKSKANDLGRVPVHLGHHPVRCPPRSSTPTVPW